MHLNKQDAAHLADKRAASDARDLGQATVPAPCKANSITVEVIVTTVQKVAVKATFARLAIEFSDLQYILNLRLVVAAGAAMKTLWRARVTV